MKTECPTCHGHKVIDVCTVTGHIVAGEFHTEKTSWQQECPDCSGTGKIEKKGAINERKTGKVIDATRGRNVGSQLTRNRNGMST